MPTLDKWIVKKDNDGEKVEPLFTVFFLDGESMKATWMREMPKQHSYSTTIKWPSLGSELVTICCNIGKNDNDQYPHFVFPSETIYNNVPYLKSHLQKCIRRSNLNLTLKTALHLARLDLQELLRRLCIIMVEDAICMPEFSTLVWIMAAVSKGYSLDKKRVYWLFGLIAKLAICQIKDPIHEPSEELEENGTNSTNSTSSTNSSVEASTAATKVTPGPKIKTSTVKPKLKQGTLNYKSLAGSDKTTDKTTNVLAGSDKTTNNVTESEKANPNPRVSTKKANNGAPVSIDRNWKKWRMYKLNDNDKSLIQTLLFRESYGGMKGDKNMLIDIASIWYQRFINNDMNDLALKYYRNQEAMADQLIYISPPEENLKPSEWILAAIDFHVVNNIIMILADKYETLTYEDIKAAIWHHSSKYTNKINLSPNKKVETDTAFNKTQKAWDIIRPEFYSLASYFLKNNH